MRPQIIIALGAAGAAFWMALQHGRSVGGSALWMCVAIGLIVALAHLCGSLLGSKWVLKHLERTKEQPSSKRLFKGIVFGCLAFAWFLAGPWFGEVAARAFTRM
jgi:hypothetical protein